MYHKLEDFKCLTFSLKHQFTPMWQNAHGYTQLQADIISQVWCDMETDGGGFMLIGRKNSPVMWSVPSNDTPLEPYGEPRWSSAFGDAPILDFRVQISTSGNMSDTAAHW